MFSHLLCESGLFTSPSAALEGPGPGMKIDLMLEGCPEPSVCVLVADYEFPVLLSDMAASNLGTMMPSIAQRDMCVTSSMTTLRAI